MENRNFLTYSIDEKTTQYQIGNDLSRPGAIRPEVYEIYTGQPGKPGKNGNPGPAGYTPVRGVDYWTSADQTYIINEVLSQIPDYEEVSF